MRVQVTFDEGGPRPYTYDAPDGVTVGDRVLVPPTAVRDDEQQATVVALGSPYNGDVRRVVAALGRPYITWRDRHGFNERRYHHPGCDGLADGARYVVPLDGAPEPGRGATEECANCAQVLPLRRGAN